MAITFNVTRFNYETWQKIYKNSNEKEWDMATCPHNVYEYIDTAIELMENEDIELTDVDRINIVTLDDDYFKYLENTGIEDTSETRAAYASQIDCDEKVLMEKAKKAGIAEAYTLMIIPAVLLKIDGATKVSNYRLDNEQTKQLTQYLEKIYGKNKVHVFGVFAPLDAIANDKEKFYANGKLFFEKNIKFEMSEFRKQRYGDAINLAFLGIPFLVKSPLKKMSFTMSEIADIVVDYKYWPEVIETLDQHDFNANGVKNINFEDTQFYKDFAKDPSLSICPIQITIYEIDDFVESVLGEMIT